ncbi:carboxylesterase/lipase family protein [Pseudonocardia sp. GCM10023141]
MKTGAGEVRGQVDGGIARFLGIPYAAAPFGPHRFRAPAPAPSWEGVRDALAFGATVPKPGYVPPFDTLLPEPAVAGEECLNVNVWAPEGATGRPVMVWIHGGAFVNGSNAIPIYDGSAFARDGVVLVGINYRLGAEGFLAIPDAPANRGMLDQVAALEWVRDNIAAFGGDPDNVTIFGESAGGISVGTLLAMPAAEGLFRRAILQSGACHHALTAATADRIAGYVAEEIGVGATLAELEQVAPERFVAAQGALSAQMSAAPDPARWGEAATNGMIFEPVIDGEVLPALAFDRVQAGASAGVDLLVGNTTEEMRLFLVPGDGIGQVPEAAIGMIAAGFGLPDGAVDAYRAARPGATPGLLMVDLVGEYMFRMPAVRLAEARPATFVYEFGWESPLFDGRLGACHALELGFVFDTLAASRGLTGATPPQALADAMHAAWVAFATSGDPGWEPYGTERKVRSFADTVETVTDPRGELRQYWTTSR